jgi:hypothetical protein
MNRYANGFAVKMVELAGVFEETLIAAGAYSFEDRANGGFGFGEASRAAGQEATDVCRFEDAEHCFK